MVEEMDMDLKPVHNTRGCVAKFTGTGVSHDR